MSRTYARDDVETHSDGYRSSLPAVNVKVYGSIDKAYAQFAKDGQPDPRFTLDWIEEHVSAERLDGVFWHVCEFEFEYLESWATGAEYSPFPDDSITLEREGRSGGWVVVRGLPEIEEWDAVRLARWRKFERIAKEIASGVPHLMLDSLYMNEFEVWSDEQDDESIANAETPVDQALAAIR